MSLSIIFQTDRSFLGVQRIIPSRHTMKMIGGAGFAGHCPPSTVHCQVPYPPPPHFARNILKIHMLGIVFSEIKANKMPSPSLGILILNNLQKVAGAPEPALSKGEVSRLLDLRSVDPMPPPHGVWVLASFP